MSGIFLKNELRGLFNNNDQSESLSISKVLNKYTKSNSVENKYITSTTINNDGTETNMLSATSSALPNNNLDLSATSPMMKNNTELSATSSMAFSNKNNLSATSSLNMNGGGFVNKNKNKNQDVDSLVAMLTTDSHTETEQLETKLKGLLNNKMDGGGIDELHNVKSFFHNLKNNGVKVDLKLDDLTLSEFFNSSSMRKNKNNTFLKGGDPLTEAAPPAVVAQTSATAVGDAPASTEAASTAVAAEAASTAVAAEATQQAQQAAAPNTNKYLLGGAKQQNGGRDLPPALVAFQKLRSFVAKELDLKGIKVSAKVASALKKDVTAKNPNSDPMEIANIAIKYFNDNRGKYEKLAKDLA